jgi:hypothetical protein
VFVRGRQAMAHEQQSTSEIASQNCPVKWRVPGLFVWERQYLFLQIASKFPRLVIAGVDLVKLLNLVKSG